jgi:hypothetical protein
MLDKKYYKLNELNSLFQISMADISYAIERQGLCLVFYRQAEKYLVGSLSNRKFVSIGCATYEGLVRLDKNSSSEVIKQKSIAVDRTVLLQMENVKDWISDYPFECKLPSSRLNDWVSADPKTLDGDTILAFPYPTEKQNPFKVFPQSAVSVSNELGASESQSENMDEKNELKPDFILDFPKIELHLNDACILSSKLMELFPTKCSLNDQ